MRFVSDDQRKAVMAKLRGGGGRGGGGYRRPGGGGGQVHGVGSAYQGVRGPNWTFGSRASGGAHYQGTLAGGGGGGFAGTTNFYSGTATSFSQYRNIWSDVFGSSLTTPKGATVWSWKIPKTPAGSMSSTDYYYHTAKNFGADAPPPAWRWKMFEPRNIQILKRGFYYAFGGKPNMNLGATATGTGTPDPKPLQSVFPWIKND